MTTGEKLQSLRKQNNYTQEELAEIMNVSRQSISKWESDVAFPETEKLITLSKLYHCSIDYLLNPDNDDVGQSVNAQKSNNKASYNKRRLPLILITLGTHLITLLLYFMTWFDGTYTLYTLTIVSGQYIRSPGPTAKFATNFYSLFDINGDLFVNAQAIKVFAIIMFALLILIVIVSVIYLFINKKAFTKIIRIANCGYLVLFTILMLLTIGPGLGWHVASGTAYSLGVLLVLVQYVIKPIRVTI